MLAFLNKYISTYIYVLYNTRHISQLPISLLSCRKHYTSLSPYSYRYSWLGHYIYFTTLKKNKFRGKRNDFFIYRTLVIGCACPAAHVAQRSAARRQQPSLETAGCRTAQKEFEEEVLGVVATAGNRLAACRSPGVACRTASSVERVSVDILFPKLVMPQPWQ